MKLIQFILGLLLLCFANSADTQKPKGNSTNTTTTNSTKNAGDEDQEEEPVTKVKKLSSRSVNLFVRQHEVIPLPKDVEQCLAPFIICTFNPKKPFLTKIIQQQVSATARSSQEATLLTRLRSIEDENTEIMIVLQKYIFVISNTTWASIYSTDSDLRLLTKFNITQRKPEHIPFKYKEQVLIVQDEFVIRCNQTGYHTSRIKSRDIFGVSMPLQLNETSFVLVNFDQLDVFVEVNGVFEAKEIISRAFMAGKFKDIETLGWTHCKLANKLLYCIDRVTGLYSFDPSNLQLSVKRISDRSGCNDFFIWNKNNTTIINLQCFVNGEFLRFTIPNTVNAQPQQYFLHSMLPVPKNPNIGAYIHKSSIELKNFAYKEQSTTLPIHEPIVGIDFVQEKIPEAELQASQKKKKQKEKKKQLEKEKKQKQKQQKLKQMTEQERKKEIAKEEKKKKKKQKQAEVVLEPMTRTVVYILFKDRISKQRLDYTLPHISCESPTPVSTKINLTLFTSDNRQEILPLKIHISAAEITPPNKSVFIVTLLFVIVGLIIFISVIYYYEKIERKLTEIYNKLAAKHKAQKKYDVENQPNKV